MNRPLLNAKNHELGSLAAGETVAAFPGFEGDAMAIAAELAHRKSRSARKLLAAIAPGELERVSPPTRIVAMAPTVSPERPVSQRGPKVIRTVHVKRSRAPADCSHCGGAIPVGSMLERVTIAGPEGLETLARCDGCCNGGEWGTCGDERWKNELVRN